MVRIHFTPEDLTRVRVAPGPDFLWEITNSVQTLQRTDGERVFGAWRRWVRPRLPESRRLLSPLLPPHGYSPRLPHPHLRRPHHARGRRRHPARYAVNETQVLAGQREFRGTLGAAGIPHEWHEVPGGPFVRPDLFRRDLDGIIARLRKA